MRVLFYKTSKFKFYDEMVSLYFITIETINDKIAKQKNDGSIMYTKISDRKELKRTNKNKISLMYKQNIYSLVEKFMMY